MPNPFDQFDASKTSEAPKANPFDQFDKTTQKSKKTSFMGDIATNTGAGIGAAGDLLTGNFAHVGSDEGAMQPSPKTEALADKLMPKGVGGQGSYKAAKDIMGNVKNTSFWDYLEAVNEKAGQSAPGKALTAIGALPEMNVAGTLINRNVVPKVSKLTGMTEEHIKDLMPLSSVLGIKGAGKIPTSKTIPITKWAAGKTADLVPKAIKVIPNAVNAVKDGKLNVVKDIYRGAQGWNPSTPESRLQERAQIKNEASPFWGAMRNSNIALVPQVTKQFAVHIINGVIQDTGKMSPRLHGETMGVLSDMKAAAEKGFTLEDLDIFRRELAQASKKGGEESKKANSAIDHLDGAFDIITKRNNELPPGQRLPEWDAITKNLETARGEWTKAKKLDVVDQIIDKAQGDPSKLKTAFNNLLNTPAGRKRISGWSKEERAALKEAAENTTVESLLALGGKFGVDISAGVQGNKIPLWTTTLMHLAGTKNKGLWETIGLGSASRKGQKLVGVGKAENLRKVIKGKNPWDENTLDDTLSGKPSDLGGVLRPVEKPPGSPPPSSGNLTKQITGRLDKTEQVLNKNADRVSAKDYFSDYDPERGYQGSGVILPDGRIFKFKPEYGRQGKYKGLGAHTQFLDETGSTGYASITSAGEDGIGVSSESPLTPQQEKAINQLRALMKKNGKGTLEVDSPFKQ